MGLPPVRLCHRHQGKGTFLWESPTHNPSPSLSSTHPLRWPACSISAEGRCIEEGPLCPGHAGYEAISAIWTKGAGLGRWTSEQPAAELLLLWWSWGVSNEGWGLRNEECGAVIWEIPGNGRERTGKGMAVGKDQGLGLLRERVSGGH